MKYGVIIKNYWAFLKRFLAKVTRKNHVAEINGSPDSTTMADSIND